MPFVLGEVEVTNEVSLAPSAVIYDGAVVADGDLTVQVNNFYYDLGGTHGKYAGSMGNAVADDSTNYVYLDSGASLVINATGYPPSGMHIRLARVVASGGFIVRVILERAFLTSAVSGSGYVPSGRKIDTTNGLQGGGDLSADRTLSPVYGSSSNTVCQGNDSRLSDDRTASGIRTATTVVSVSAAAEPTLGQVLVAASGTSAAWANLCAGSDGWIQFNDDGVFGAQSGFAYDKASGTLTIGPATIYPNNPLNIAANLDDYSQVTFQNKSSGTSASTDIVLTADNGNDDSFYADFGIGGSNYASGDYTLYGPNDAYLISSDSNLILGTYAADTAVKFHLGGGNVEDLVATLDATGFNLATGLVFKINGVALPSLTSSAPSDVTKATAAVGTATDAARSDHKHDVSTGTAGAQAPGDTALEGVATSLARSDHRHSLPAFGSGSGTFCEGNDSRLADDRTASGLRSATTVVVVSSATAPSNGQSLVASSGTAASWVTVHGDFSNGGDTAGAARTLGNNDNYGLTFRTNNTVRLTIAAGGDVTAAGKLLSTSYFSGSGPDLSVLPITSGQSVITSYYGLQLVGNKQGTVDYSPSNIGAAGAYGVIIPSQQTGAVSLGVRAIISQTANIQNWESSAGTALMAVTSAGNIVFNSTQTVDGRDVSVDGAKLDGIASGATNTPLTSTAPVNVTKATAAVGTSGEAARQDHKHDVTTAAAVGNPPGTSNAEGTATSLARSDHTHQLASFGTGSGTFCQGNDSRLSDARTPTSHATSHKNGGSDEVATATATANSIPKTGATTTLAIGWIPTGSSSSTVCIGNDSRLSDARTPTAHATSHKNGGSDEVATATAAANSIPKTGATTTLDIGWIPTGSTGTTVCIGNDSRLSNARTPTSHASTHLPGGSDALTTATAATITDSTNAEGSATSFARSDHSHSHGTRGGGTLHAATSSSGAGFMQQSNMAAAVNPTVNNDNTQGYAVGSHWWNTTANTLWVAYSVATGAAVWRRLLSGTTWPFTASLTVDPTNANADYSTIAAAIAAASAGTVIFIAPGTYAEQLTLKDGVTLIGMGSTRYGGNQVLVSVSSATGFDLLTKNSAGTAYLENIVFLGVLSGAGTVNCLNLVSGGVRAQQCLFQVIISATTGTEVGAAVNSAGLFQATQCSIIGSDSQNRNTSVSGVRTSGTMELVECNVSLSDTASTEGGIYITAGTLTLDDCSVTSSTASQAIKRTGGTVTYRGGPSYLDKETDDTDSPSTAANFPKQFWGVLATDGTSGNRAYKLPCRSIAADPSTLVDGDIWYNSTSNAFKAYENGAVVTLRSAASVMAAAMARRTTTFAVTATWQNVTYNESTVETNTAVVDHLAANQDRIQVFVSGTYLITYFFNVTPSATIGTSGRVRKNDTTVIPGSELTTQNYANEDNPLSVSFLASLAANDYVSVQVVQGSGTGTMLAGASVTVTKLDGMQGPPGSGSTVTVQDDGISIPNTPHATLNFGSGLTAADSGSSIALVTLDTHPPMGDSATHPTAPTSGTKLFSKFRAGRRMTAQIGPTGMDYAFQPSLFGNKVGWWTAMGNGSTVTAINFGASNTGTLTTRTVSSTSFFTSVRRLGFVSATTAGSAAGTRHNLAQFWRGNASGLGGFFYVVRFGISQTQTGYRWLVGLSNTTALFGNAEPSTFLNFVGIGQDSTDANIQFMHNDGSGTATKVDLGASWPKPTANTQFYEFRLFIAPNGNTYYWSLENLNPAASDYTEGDTAASANIPSATTFLSPQVWINNNAQLAAVGIDVSSSYIETDN